PPVSLSTTEVPDTVTPVSVTRFEAESACMLYVPAAEFGLEKVGQHAMLEGDGAITVTVPDAVSFTNTAPPPEVAEKFGAEIPTGLPELPIAAFAEYKTTFVNEPEDIEPLMALSAATQSVVAV